MQNMPVVSKTDGMAGIVSALITGDAVEFFRENIDNFIFAFVVLLGIYNCDIAFH